MNVELIQQEQGIIPVPQIENEEDRLAKFRGQEPEPRSKMSESAKTKLREQAEQDRFNAIDALRLKSALASVIITPENLRKLIQRCSTSSSLPLDRMVAKLHWWITAGYLLGREIDSVAAIHLLSDLTPEERSMSDSKFSSLWNIRDAEKRKEYRLSHGIIDTGEITVRPCKSGKQCLRFEKRKPAPAKGRGEFCSSACAASDRARQKRALAGSPIGSIQ